MEHGILTTRQSNPLGGGQSNQEPETRSFSWVSRVGTRAQGLDPSSTTFQVHKWKAKTEVEPQELEQEPIWMQALEVED